MAIDKAIDSSALDSNLTSVANAIRTKGGTSAQLAFPAGFVSAINAISTGARVQTDSGSFTTDANGAAIVNCGFKPDFVYIDGLFYTDETPALHYVFGFPLFIYDSTKNEAITTSAAIDWDDGDNPYAEIAMIPQNSGFSVSCSYNDWHWDYPALTNYTANYTAMKWTA